MTYLYLLWKYTERNFVDGVREEAGRYIIHASLPLLVRTQYIVCRAKMMLILSGGEKFAWYSNVINWGCHWLRHISMYLRYYGDNIFLSLTRPLFIVLLEQGNFPNVMNNFCLHKFFFSEIIHFWASVGLQSRELWLMVIRIIIWYRIYFVPGTYSSWTANCKNVYDSNPWLLVVAKFLTL